MATRINVLVSDKVVDIIAKYQKKNGYSNRDSAVQEFILEHGSA